MKRPKLSVGLVFFVIFALLSVAFYTFWQNSLHAEIIDENEIQTNLIGLYVMIIAAFLSLVGGILELYYFIHKAYKVNKIHEIQIEDAHKKLHELLNKQYNYHSHYGKIIFLNGVSSSGKTTIGKALVKKLPHFFYLSIDDFDYLIEHMENRPDHFIPVETEYFFHQMIKVFSNKGVNLVVDQILHDDFTLKNCFKLLNDYPVYFVGIKCPIEELENRENRRNDRELGLAKKQLAFVHKQEVYDLEIDTSIETVDSSVNKIIEGIQQFDTPNGWLKTYLKVRQD